MQCLPLEKWQECSALPVYYSDGVICVISNSKEEYTILNNLQKYFMQSIKFKIIKTDCDIFLYLKKPSIPCLSDLSDTELVPKFVDDIINEAIWIGASDIHIHPRINDVLISYRIDGFLSEYYCISREKYIYVIGRLKVSANLNTSEHRIPQQGHISYPKADIRIACHPTIYGENIVLRILEKQKMIADSSSLGLHPKILEHLKSCVKKTNGMVLLLGPTGCGKTTTLYSILNENLPRNLNCMTLEDPVEVVIPWMKQSSINEDIGWDFESGLVSLLRQDPDIIVLGEMRSKSTAQIAFRSALTGHQVYSTLHSHDSIKALSRLSDLGISNQIIDDTLLCMLGQRLVRIFCPICSYGLRKAIGCDVCKDGYFGRSAIGELWIKGLENPVITFDESLKFLIDRGITNDEDFH
jgi:type II secretory ATPase GspE/PulE/Tfp pilus assembly ATPase PilB-like protein